MVTSRRVGKFFGLAFAGLLQTTVMVNMVGASEGTPTDDVLSSFRKNGALVFSDTSQLSSFQLGRYQSAAEKFPNLESCLVDSSKEKLRLDWHSLRRPVEAEVCLFHVARHLEFPSKLAEWFQDEGFSAGFRDIFGRAAAGEKGTVFASMKFPSTTNPHAFSRGRFRFDRLTASSITIGVRFDGAKVIENINITFIRE